MREVETKIKPLEDWFDAEGNSHEALYDIVVKSTTLWRQDRVRLQVLGNTFEVSKRDLIAAIENATNFSSGE